MDFTRDETSETPVAPASVPGAPLPYAVATWLQRVEAAASEGRADDCRA
jgi:hypothetical protein